MIKVLHIQLSDKIGGIETFLKNIVKFNNTKKIQYEFISTSENNTINSYFFHNHCNVHCVPSEKHLIRYMLAMHKVIKNGRYDIVHIHKNSCANIIPLILCKINKVNKIFIHSHNTASNYGKITNLIHYINRPFVRKAADKKLACSKSAAIWLYGKKHIKNVTIINNGIDMTSFQFSEKDRISLRRKLKIKDHELLLIHIGRFEKQKNHAFLAAVFNELCKQDQDWKLLMIGKGSLKHEIEQYIYMNGLQDKVIWIDETQKVNSYLSAADVFLLPSLYEGLPIVLVEAQAIGINIIASDKISLESKINDNFVYLSIENKFDWVDVLCKNKEKYKNWYKNICIADSLKFYDVKNTENMLINQYIEE